MVISCSAFVLLLFAPDYIIRCTHQHIPAAHLYCYLSSALFFARVIACLIDFHFLFSSFILFAPCFVSIWYHTLTYYTSRNNWVNVDYRRVIWVNVWYSLISSLFRVFPRFFNFCPTWSSVLQYHAQQALQRIYPASTIACSRFLFLRRTMPQ